MEVASVLTGPTVLDFPDPTTEIAVHVNHGLFWANNVDLGINFFWDTYVAPRTAGYVVSDGYGGGHAMLWGPERGDDNQMVFKGNIWNGQGSVMFAALEGPAPGEWGYHALSMVKDMYSDNVFIYTYWNGITVGITQFGNLLTRHSRTPNEGNNVLYVMGSNHQNLGGRLAALRVWDRSSPFATATTAAAAFVPERVFSSQLGDGTPADFLADYTRPAVTIPDLSPRGYAGGGTGVPERHPGRIVNAAHSVDTTFQSTFPPIGPLATWVVDPSCPYAVAGALPPNPNENIPAPAPIPPKALVFDSFGRRSQNFLWQQVPTLGKTEGGTLGRLDWKTAIVGPTARVPSSWGIINGRAVFLENQPGLAWVDVGTPDQEIRIRRFTGANPTGVAFRVQDRQNFWFAVVPTKIDPVIPAAVHVGYFQNGTLHDVGSFLPPNHQWLNLRVQAIGSTINVYRDDVPLGSVSNATQLQTATGAGLTGATNTAWASSFWRGDDFTVCGASGC